MRLGVVRDIPFLRRTARIPGRTGEAEEELEEQIEELE